MILFNDPSTSTTMTVIISTLNILSFIVSSFLNPTVFFFNRKKSSIAGLLFRIISATDFTICLVLPIAFFYYAATVNPEQMNCTENESVPRQLLNCYTEVTSISLAITTAVGLLNSIVFMTTGVLTIVRTIQIKYPFYYVRKSRVLFLLVLAVVTQGAAVSFLCLSPLGEKRFYPARYVAAAVNPYGLEIGESERDSERVEIISLHISFIPLGIMEILASVASVITAVTLFQMRNSEEIQARGRTVGAVKVLLTNLFSLIYGLLFGTPISYLFFSMMVHGSNDKLKTEMDGWIAYSITAMFPLLSSVWNPIVFISLTPKSRETLRSLYATLRRVSRVGPQQE